MELGIFLARAWGLFMLLVCAGLILNRKNFAAVVKDLSAANVFILGCITLAAGIAQVIGYQIWSVSWMGLITLFGWLALLKGLALVVIPNYLETWKRITAKNSFSTITLWIGLILGAYLIYVGFFGQ